MTQTLMLVVYAALLTWLTIMLASLMRARAWTLPGLLLAFGNRDKMPDPTVVAGRADRTARNTMENFVLFAVIALVVHAAGRDGPQALQGATVFFWCRVAYVPIYYAGLPYLRTAAWLGGIVGICMMLMALH